MKKLGVLILMIIVSIPIAGLGNAMPGSFYGPGNAKQIVVEDNDDIRIVKEDLSIYLSNTHAYFVVKYEMSNLSSADSEVPFVFPFTMTGGSMRDLYDDYDFEAYADNERLDHEEIIDTLYRGDFDFHTVNMTSSFQIEKNAGTELIIKYNTYYESGPSLWYSFDYYLTNAEGWAGKADQVDITIYNHTTGKYKIWVNKHEPMLQWDSLSYSFSDYDFGEGENIHIVLHDVQLYPENYDDLLQLFKWQSGFYGSWNAIYTNDIAITLSGYPLNNLVDGDITTAWVEGESDAGIGTFIFLNAEGNFDIDKIRIFPGYGKSEERFYQNNRLKKIEIWYNQKGYFSEKDVIMDRTVQTVYFEDSFEWQEIIPDQTDFHGCFIWINDVYYGSKWNDTCISEIELIPAGFDED